MRTTTALSLLTGLVTAAAVTLSACGGTSPPVPSSAHGAAELPALPALPAPRPGAPVASPVKGAAVADTAGPGAGVSAAGVPAAQVPAPAPVANPPAGVTATGSGIVSGSPDTLQISIGVQAEAAHAADALAQGNAGAASVQAALRHDGVAAADLQTGELSLYPRSTGSGNQVDGYQVSNRVSATLRDLGRAGQVIDDVVAAAGDAGRLEGVDFSFADASPLLAQARQKAVAAARDQAAQMAAAAGEKLGVLRSLTDQSSPISIPPRMAMGAATPAGSAASVPVQPGTQQLTVQVTGVWDLVPA